MQLRPLAAETAPTPAAYICAGCCWLEAAPSSGAATHGFELSGGGDGPAQRQRAGDAGTPADMPAHTQAVLSLSHSLSLSEYLQLRPLAAETASYTPAAYLKAVGGWRQRQAVAQLRGRVSWRWRGADTTAANGQSECAIQRCSSSATDDAEHMVFDCSALESYRWNHPCLFIRDSRSLTDFFDQDPTKLAAFVYECKKSCTARSG